MYTWWLDNSDRKCARLYNCMYGLESESKLEFFLFLFLFREKENASNLANLFEEERKTGFFKCTCVYR